MIEIWTDGACSGNPGPGGWGVLIREGATSRELHGGEAATTNNRMELTAAISALESLPEGASCILHTDSQYVKDGLTKWIRGWKKNGWKTADRKPVKNQAHWVELDSLVQIHKINWHWLKGHAGHPENERCDELARLEIDKLR